MEYGFGSAGNGLVLPPNLFGSLGETLMPRITPHFRTQRGFEADTTNIEVNGLVGMLQDHPIVIAELRVPNRRTENQPQLRTD